MNTLDRMFEVRVLVRNPIRMFKMFHFEANSRKHAENRGKKHGHVLSVRKVNATDYTRGIEFIELNQEPLGVYLGGGMYEKDINLDEILGLNKKKKET